LPSLELVDDVHTGSKFLSLLNLEQFKTNIYDHKIFFPTIMIEFLPTQKRIQEIIIIEDGQITTAGLQIISIKLGLIEPSRCTCSTSGLIQFHLYHYFIW
jgi:hypothetical protein